MRINLTGDTPAFGLGHHAPVFDPLTILSAGSALFTAGGSILGGISQKKAYDAQASQLERQANAERAQASHAAAQKYADQKELMSNQQAIAAASGGDALDPSILDLQADTAGRGFQQRGAIVANGENTARGYEEQAAAAKQSGKSAMVGGIIGAAGSALKAGAQYLTPSTSVLGAGTTAAFAKYGQGRMPTASLIEDPFDEQSYFRGYK